MLGTFFGARLCDRIGARWLLGICAIAVLTTSSGCEFSTSGNRESTEAELPAWLSEGGDAAASAGKSASVEVPLRLKVGDRFALKKTVDQALLQATVSGVPARNQARLELKFGISVEAQEQQRTRLGVRYNRIRYVHDVAGERLEYDSSYPPNPVPLPVQAYHDMIGDGFSFWLGHDNQIVAEGDLQEFLKRSLRNIPVEKQAEVMLAIEAASGETGFANFVDNSIGLLPFGKKQAPGDFWQKSQSVPRPVPMHIDTTYTLESLTPDYAVVDVRQEIAPSTAVAMVSAENGVRVTVVGGEAKGRCTIYRDTGLPKESRIERTVHMVVQMSDAIQFNQTKKITTTIEAFPASGSSSPTVIGLGPKQ